MVDEIKEKIRQRLEELDISATKASKDLGFPVHVYIRERNALKGSYFVRLSKIVEYLGGKICINWNDEGGDGKAAEP